MTAALSYVAEQKGPFQCNVCLIAKMSYRSFSQPSVAAEVIKKWQFRRFLSSYCNSFSFDEIVTDKFCKCGCDNTRTPTLVNVTGWRLPLYPPSQTCENALTGIERNNVTTPLAEILHNIADHTETILHVINDPGVPGDVTQRMFSHILLEEKENTAKLEEIHGAGPTLLTQKLLDHSFFIQRMLQEQAMSIDLKRELLDHFMEEHQEWRIELLGPDAPPHTGGKPGVVSNFGSHQARPAGSSGQGGHGGSGHGGHGGGSSHGGHAHGGSGHGGSGHAQQDKSQHGGRSEHGHSGSGQAGHSGQKGKPGTTGATKRDWTVGPLWPQGG